LAEKYLSRTKKTVMIDVVVVNNVIGLKGWERGEGVRIKGWGSCYQARDQSGWGFATMSKTSAFQVSWGSFLLSTSGLNW
jgi:hypothetical protein